MASAIDPTLAGDMTEDGRSVDKSNLVTALTAAKDEIDDLQAFDAAPQLINVRETAPAVNVSGAVSLDYTLGNVRRLTMTGNVTSLAITNVPASGNAAFLAIRLAQDGTGGRTWADPSGTNYAGGTPPTLPSDAGSYSWITYGTVDGGTSWDLFDGGTDFL